jgi:hypothetical protein
VEGGPGRAAGNVDAALRKVNYFMPLNAWRVTACGGRRSSGVFDGPGCAPCSRGWASRVRGLDRPQYRLRVDEVRVFYDVSETAVEVLAIVSKAKAQEWLEQEGTSSSPRGSGESEG